MIWRPLGVLKTVRDSVKSKNMFITIPRCYMPFVPLVSHKCSVEFSRSSMTCGNVVILEANGMFACVFCA